MSTRWACVLGQPARHSLSPALHNAAFAALGLDAVYDAQEVDAADLPAVVAAMRRDPLFLGANVTAPHKERVMPLLDDLSAEARTLGAVNTLVPRDRRLLGHNTDALGLMRWFELAALPVAGRPAVVLGAGGAARATVVALGRLGAPAVRVLNRTVERAERLVADLRPHLPGVDLLVGGLDEAAAAARSPAGVVVNATSLGHQGSAPVVHPSWYAGAAVAVELAYQPPETAFMAAARAAGARAENGLGMLLHQAVLAFEQWTGHTPPLAVYEAAVARALASREPAAAAPKGPTA